jgi:hypothetical protein
MAVRLDGRKPPNTSVKRVSEYEVWSKIATADYQVELRAMTW